MFIKLTVKENKKDTDWRISIFDCKEAHYVPIEKSEELTKPDDILKITGYVHIEPGKRRITLWKNKLKKEGVI